MKFTPGRISRTLTLSLLILLTMSLGTLWSTPARAATLTVTNSADSGAGTLRDTIAAAAAGDTITFSIPGPINLTSGELVINKNLTITGPATAGGITINAGGTSRVFTIQGFTVTVGLSNLTITGGTAIYGGGIVNTGTLTVNNSTLSGNSGNDLGGAIFNDQGATLTVTNSTLSGNGGGYGGGIVNFSTLTVTSSTFSDNGAYEGGGINNRGLLTVTNSTFSDNQASGGGGGGIANLNVLTVTSSTFSDNITYTGPGGGIFNYGTVEVTNSTLSGNLANRGGGIYSYGEVYDGLIQAPLTVTSSTLSGNYGYNGGGGIYNNDGTEYGTDGAPLYLSSSIVAGNTVGPGGGGGPDIFGTVGSGDYNLVQDTSGATLTGTNNVTGVDPQLGALADNGGPTKTKALASTSPAIDEGDPSGPATDQRGFGFVRPAGAANDIGAYEFGAVEAPSLVVTTNSDASTNTDGLTSLREAITYANSKAGDDAITFDIAGAGPHIIALTHALPNLSTPVTITGPTEESVTVDGGDDSFVIFTVNLGVSVEFSGLTISNGLYGINNNGTATVTGSTLSGNDMGITNQGTLTVTGSTLSGNSNNGIVNSDIATVTGSTLSGNYIGIWNYSTLTVTNSTLSGNQSAIYNMSGTATVTNCTVSGNSSMGIYNDHDAYEVHVTNSIVSGNSVNVGATLVTDDHNLIDVDAKLGPLQDNGGPTHTHALLYGSPAMDAGNDALAPATDQRGVLRPQGSHSDIGAYEAQQYQISGYVRTNALTPIADTTMTLQSTGSVVGPTVQTDANGFYTFSALPADNYTVTPTKADWSFTPASQALSISTSSRGANFVGARTAATYNVSGRISTGNGTTLAGVSVALTPREDGVVSPVTTNGAGYYTFTNVPAGDYTITPTLSNYTFSPPSHSITVNAQHVSGKNFIGATGHKLIGRVMTSNGSALAGVTVARTGAGSTSATTNSAGYYTFFNVPDGNITVTPSKSGYIFTPSSKVVAMSGADVSGQNFIGATGYSVTGRIATSSGVAMSGVSVQLGNGPIVQTNSAGYYTFTGVADGQHTLTPSKSGFSFMPEQKTVEVNGANVGGQNFTGTGS